MYPKFKLWSESSNSAKQKLRPTLELRSWADLSESDKTKIVKHLLSKGWIKDTDIHVTCIEHLNDSYKLNIYGKNLFSHGGPHHTNWGYERCCQEVASEDFFRIITKEDSDVVFELLSIYASTLVQEYYMNDDEVSEDDVDKAYNEFDKFSSAVNDIFDHFGVNITLTRENFVPKQEEVIEEYVIEPTFKGLTGKKWSPVQTEFKEAISEYRKHTKSSYSNAITHLVSALQAFLQIKIRGETGKGDIDALIREGMKQNKLPNDQLSKKVLSGLKSMVMEYRQKQGDAHPKKEYANEESVRVILNSVAVFIQHCIK